MGKPLVWMRPSVRYPAQTSVFDKAALLVDRRKDLATAIRRLVQPPVDRCDLAALGQRHLSELLAHADGRATDAVVAAIDTLISG